jgi:glycosyltransferase involved in cell wall biosynthesis
VLQKSIREGFGLTVTEAMWKGTPVIGGRVGWGLMTIRNSGVNQKGEPVISFVSVAFVERRTGAA